MAAPAEHFVSSMPALRAEVKVKMLVWSRTSSVLTVQRGKSGGVVEVELVGRVSRVRRTIEKRHRRRAGWPGLRDLDRQPEVSQEALNHRRVFDQRDQPADSRY